jgi:environmental stress-induced protein Ves
MTIISKKNQLVSKWSGGTTTELFIFPPEASYANRDFVFRISTATVETETSTFTSLPGFKRILMILNGELEITHANHYSTKLCPFEMDTFDGNWQTTAKGKVTDFNIMFAAGIHAKLTAHTLNPDTTVVFNRTSTFQFVYLVSGNAFLNDQTPVTASDFIILTEQESNTITAVNFCNMLIIEITLES